MSYLIGLGHFSHIVAGAVQTFYVAVTGESSWGAVIGGYLVPTFLGNVVGGVALVAALNHAQVVSGAKNKKAESLAAWNSASAAKAQGGGGRV